MQTYLLVVYMEYGYNIVVTNHYQKSSWTLKFSRFLWPIDCVFVWEKKTCKKIQLKFTVFSMEL